MKKVKANIQINDEPIHLNVKVTMGTNVVLYERAHSFTLGFLQMLGATFRRISSTYTKRDTIRGNSSVDDVDFSSHTNIPIAWYSIATSVLSSPASTFPDSLNITAVDGNSITVSHVSTAWVSDIIRSSDWVVIKAGNGNEGTYKVDDVEALTSTTTKFTLNGFSEAGNVTLDTCHAIGSFARRTSSNSNFPVGTIQNITLGASTKPSSVTDMYLYDEYDTTIFERGSNNYVLDVSTPVRTGGNRSVFSITQTFTNISPDPQTINEIGLLSAYMNSSGNAIVQIADWENKKINKQILASSRWQHGWLIARDVLSSSRVVASGETITVTYEIVINTNEEYGMVGGFNDILRRVFSRNTTSVDNYFNVTSTTTADNFDWAFVNVAPLYFINSQDYIGIQIGNGTDGIDIDNFRIQSSSAAETRILHGSYDGALRALDETYISGTQVISDGEAELVLERSYINETTGSIDVNELGFNVAANSTITPVLISRAILPISDRVTVQPGEVLKAQYIFAISGSSGS